MANYCTTGQKARLLVNGTAVGTYAAPLDISIQNNPIPWPSWMDESTKQATTVLPPGIYTVTIYPLCGGSPTTRSYSVRAIFKPPTQFSHNCPGLGNRSYYSSTDIVALYPSGTVSLWQVLGSSVSPSTTFSKTGENGYRLGYILTVKDGNNNTIHDKSYSTEPTYESECLDLLTEDEWRDRYDDPNDPNYRPPPDCPECDCTPIENTLNGLLSNLRGISV